MTDVVFMSGFQDDLLPKSVSSLLEHGTGLGRAVVVGRQPPGLPKDAVPFLAPPIYERGAKRDNALYAILRAIESGCVSSADFLLVPPGFTLASTCDLDACPVYFSHDAIRTVEDLVVAGKGSAVVTRHRVALSDTRKLLERNGLPSVDFSGAGFMSRLASRCAGRVRDLWLQEPHGVFGYDIPSLFQNVRIASERTNVVRFDHAPPRPDGLPLGNG